MKRTKACKYTLFLHLKVQKHNLFKQKFQIIDLYLDNLINYSNLLH
jgi:hypothetical protein